MPTATTSASALSRHGASARASVYPVNRSSSPPASTYFTPFSGDHHEDPQPASAEASSHFAYSTSLVRHRENSLGLPLPASANGLPKFEDLRTVVENEGPSGLWQRSVDAVKTWLKGKDDGYDRLPTTQKETKEQKETPSAVFAHHTPEVSSDMPLLYHELR